MRRTVLAIAGIVSLAIIAAPSAASAHWGGKTYGKNRICQTADWRQNALFQHYDQNNRHLNARIQFWINTENERNCSQTSGIMDTLKANGNFKTLSAAVEATGLTGTLNSGAFTLFAPTDQAFAKLPAGTVEALLANPSQLSSILTYHAVSGVVPAATAKTLTSAPTVNGASINISKRDGKLFINDSRVVLYDIKTSNGIVHVIDTVLLP